MSIVKSASQVDILKKQLENEESYHEHHDRYEAQQKELNAEIKSRANALQGYIKDLLSSYIEPLHIMVSVSLAKTQGRTVEPYYNIDIESNSTVYYMFKDIAREDIQKEQEKVALNWSVHIKVNEDGEIEKTTSSWSGFNANTPELIDNLQLSVDCLRDINDIDWFTVLSENTPPNYEDYVTEDYTDEEYQETKNNLDRELLEQQVRETIGKNEVLKGRGSWGFDYTSDDYIKVIKETAKQYTYIKIGKNELEKGEDSFINNFTDRISKDRFFRAVVVTPIEVVEY